MVQVLIVRTWQGLTCMTMRATLSGSDQLAPLKATAKWMLGMSGSLMRTSDPVHRKGSCDGKRKSILFLPWL